MTYLPLIIVNPAAAAGATKRDWPRLAARIRDHFGAFKCVFTQYPGHGRKLAQAAAQAGQRLIIACGGDGTISEIANGIIEANQPVALGILPYGTGGDLRRSLDIPLRLEDAARLLTKSTIRKIDVGRVTFINTEDQPETRYFLNVASIGMGGAVVERSEQTTKSLGGKVAYAYATLATALDFEAPTVWLNIDNQGPKRRVIANISIANGRYFGGGMKIAPHAKLNDGKLDIIAIRELSTTALLGNVPRLYRGTHLDLPYVASTQGQTIEVEPVDKQSVILLEVDGELAGKLPAQFSICPQALQVCCP